MKHRSKRRSVALFVLALSSSLLAAQPPSKSPRLAASPTAPGKQQVIRSLVDANTHNLTDDLRILEGWYTSLPAVQPKGRMTVAQAVANARALLARQMSQTQITALRSNKFAKTARSLQGLATGAIVDGRPQAALAALLLAQEKAPGDRMVLINLAGLLASLGMPEEALALLDEAEKGRGLLPSPMGIPGRAIAQNNRGFAMIMLKRCAEAEAPLREAMNASPLLSEAARNLALVLAILGQEEEAKKVLYFGVWRSRGTLEPARSNEEPESGTPGEQPNLAPKTPSEVSKTLLNARLRRSIREVFDLSAGLGTNLPAIHHPVNADEAKGFQEMVRRRTPQFRNRLMELTQEHARLKSEVRDRPKTLSRWLSERILAIIEGYAAHRSAEVEALIEIRKRVEKKAHAASLAGHEKIRGQQRALDPLLPHNTRKARIKGFYDEYVDEIHETAVRLEGALREEWSAKYHDLTGLAANLKDPSYHALAVNHIRKEEAGAYSRLLGAIGTLYSGYMSKKDLPDGEEPGEDEVPNCPDRLKGQGLEGDLKLFSVSLSCDTVEVQIQTEGWLGAFAKVEITTSDFTVMAGPTASGELFGGGGSVEDGIYLTVGQEGVKDVGFRVTFERSLEIAPGLKFTTEFDSMDFSFVPSAPLPSEAL